MRIANECSGWSPKQGARLGGQVDDSSIYAHPVVHGDDERQKAWCINPECGKRLNHINAKRICLCHQCERRWQDGLLVLLANANRIVGIPASGAIATFDHIDLVKSVSKRGGIVTKSLQ